MKHTAQREVLGSIPKKEKNKTKTKTPPATKEPGVVTVLLIPALRRGGVGWGMEVA